MSTTLHHSRSHGQTERSGPIRLQLVPTWTGGRLCIKIAATWFAGIPLPQILGPASRSAGWQDDQGRFRFDVSAELFGRVLIRYHGHHITQL